MYWCHRSMSALVQEMVWCHMAPDHFKRVKRGVALMLNCIQLLDEISNICIGVIGLCQHWFKKWSGAIFFRILSIFSQKGCLKCISVSSVCTDNFCESHRLVTSTSHFKAAMTYCFIGFWSSRQRQASLDDQCGEHCEIPNFRIQTACLRVGYTYKNKSTD